MASLMGGGAQTDFAPGGVMRTRHSAGDQLSSLGGGGYNPLDVVKNLRAEKEQARREGAEWDAQFARQQQWKDSALSAAPRDNARLKEAAEREGLLANMAQSRAQYQPAPTKMLFGAGIVPGRIMDDAPMSGAQRQAYLPQNAVIPSATRQRQALT